MLMLILKGVAKLLKVAMSLMSDKPCIRYAKYEEYFFRLTFFVVLSSTYLENIILVLF